MAVGLGALSAYEGYEIARGATDLVGGGMRYVGSAVEPIRQNIARSQIAKNPMITPDVVEREFRRQSTQVDNNTIGSLGRIETSRNLFGESGGVPQSFTNKYAPKVSGSPQGSSLKSDYNGVGLN